MVTVFLFRPRFTGQFLLEAFTAQILRQLKIFGATNEAQANHRKHKKGKLMTFVSH